MIELQARLREARDAHAQEAMHDPLTGALNRRAFTEVLSRALSRERRTARGLAVGVCDIDQFKKVNDTHGHEVGDEVLCELVRMMGSTLREHDVLGRHGGDEFVVLTEGDAANDPIDPYERVRAAVADHPMPTSVGQVAITISFGVRLWREGETGAELLAAADGALYRAKDAGRNRVCLADEPTPSGNAGSPPLEGGPTQS